MTDRIAICHSMKDTLLSEFPILPPQSIACNCDQRFDSFPSVRLVFPVGCEWSVADIDFMADCIEVEFDTEYGVQRRFDYADPRCIEELLEYMRVALCQKRQI